MIKQVLIICCCVFFWSVSTAQVPDTIEATQAITDDEQYEEVIEPIDTLIRVREIIINADSANAWKSRPEFKYIHTLDSLLQKSQQVQVPKKRSSGNSASNNFLGGAFIKFFLWTLALLFVIIIVYQLSKSGRLFTASKKDAQVVETPDEEELLLQHNFDELIANAKNAQDYRLATRYYFLKLLQQLREKHLIAFEPDKTNSRYLRELPLAMQMPFSGIVLKYEFVWYGHHDIGQQQFALMEKEFQQFSQKI